MTVDDQSEISFSIHQGVLPWKPIYVGLNYTFAVALAYVKRSAHWRRQGGPAPPMAGQKNFFC